MAIPFSGARGAANPGATDAEHARYIGAVTCQSSMCHGGASPTRCQYAIWSHDDAHAHAYASLVSAYGANIATAAGIASPTTDARCVSCHAPLAMPNVDLASTANVIEGVTCESCHNAAAAWLRSHTRPDFSYADRVHAGIRDLRDAYVRADTCVKCHQAIAPDLVTKFGHPPLTFELDGQTASEPRHWMEKDSWFGAKAWLVGQLVALRDTCREVARNGAESRDVTQEGALIWLVAQVPGVPLPAQTVPMGYSDVAAWSNQTAQTISSQGWSEARTRELLSALAGTSQSFHDANVAQADQAARAQRLVLALDRLLKATHPQPQANPMRPPVAQPPLPGEAELGVLFSEAQDPKTFDPGKFADSLRKFADVVAPK